MCLSKFLIFVASKLVGAKIKESKTNEKPLHILEMYMIVFNCTRTYA